MIDTLKDAILFSWPTIIIVLSIVVIIRVAYYKNNKKKLVFHEELLLLLFITYILILFQLVTYKETEIAGINLMPFKEILRYDVGTDNFYKQVLGNIILFIPFGYFVTYYAKLKKIGSITLITLFASVTIETVQYFIGRCLDIDDILLNVVGGIIGFLLFIGLDAIRKHLPGLFQKDIIYTLLSLALIGFIILYMFGFISIGG